jgi:hypothetical protein
LLLTVPEKVDGQSTGDLTSPLLCIGKTQKASNGKRDKFYLVVYCIPQIS